MSPRATALGTQSARETQPWLQRTRFAELPYTYRVFVISLIGIVALGCAVAVQHVNPALAVIIGAAVFVSYGLGPVLPNPIGGISVFDLPTRYSVALLFDPATAMLGTAAGVGMGAWLAHKREPWRAMLNAATFASGTTAAALAARWLVAHMGLTFAMVLVPTVVVGVAHLVNVALSCITSYCRYGRAIWPQVKVIFAENVGGYAVDIVFLVPVAMGAVLLPSQWWPTLLVVSIIMSRVNAWFMLSQSTRSGEGPTTVASHALPSDDPLLKRVAEDLGQGVGLLTPDGVVLGMTPVGRHAFGRQQLVPDIRLVDLCLPADAPRVARAIAEACRTTDEVAVDVRTGGAIEVPRWLHLRLINRIDDPGIGRIIVTIRSFADDAALSHRLRGYADHAVAGQIIAAQEQERTRMSRELEDNVGQVLTVARSLLEQVQHAARVLQRGLRPPALDDLGLVEAIRAYCAELGHAGTDVIVESDLAPGHRFPGDVEVTAYRIVHEALTALLPVNGPARATVSIALRGTALVVALEGPRNSPQARPLNRGALLVLQERAELVGGRVATEPLDGNVVRIVVELPASERS